MELHLNIYNELDDVIKTYTRQSYALRMRQLKDIITAFDLDKLSTLLTSNGDNTELIGVVSNFILNGYEKVQELLKDIFPGLTDEEYMDTHINEVAQVIISLAKYTIATIGIANNGKKK